MAKRWFQEATLDAITSIQAHCAFHGFSAEVTKGMVEEFKKSGYTKSPHGDVEWGARPNETNVLPPESGAGGPPDAPAADRGGKSKPGSGGSDTGTGPKPT